MEKGTQGKVTRCLREGRVVWIKTPHPSQERSFLREVDIVKDLTDRHIIQYYSYSIEKLELVMEDAEGGNLQSAIPKLPWEHKERIAGEIAHGISYIHSLGIVHCDIKSPNILLTRSLVVKLCDFGSARVVTNNKDKTPCSGTPGWMAPEWLQDATAYSPKSDIYALGIVMWEMASGDEPCNRSQVLEERLEDVPVEYQGIMQDCWSLEPERRPDARAISIMKYGRDSKQAVEYMMRL
ncbi:kinase-like domain-containing protein, partial [Dissophora ornata]